MGFFESCHKCVPPKRHPGCHDHCPDREKDLEKYMKCKDAADKRKMVRNSIYTQRTNGVVKAIRKHGRKR